MGPTLAASNDAARHMQHNSHSTDSRANVDYTYRTTDIVTRYIAPAAVVQLRKGTYANPLRYMDHMSIAAAGECFFACIAIAVYGDISRHQEIRNNICNFLQYRLDRYARLSASEKALVRIQLLPLSTLHEQSLDDYDVRLHGNHYIQHMRKPGTSADNTEIGVACNLYRINIKLFSFDTVKQSHSPIKDFDAEPVHGNDTGRYVQINTATIAILHEFHHRGIGSSRAPLQIPGQPAPSHKQRAHNNANQDSGHYTIYAVKTSHAPPAATGDEPKSAAQHAAALLREAYRSRNKATGDGFPPAAQKTKPSAPSGTAKDAQDAEASRIKGYVQYYDKEIRECEAVHRSLEALHQKYAKLVQVQIDKKKATEERLLYMVTCRAYYEDPGSGAV